MSTALAINVFDFPPVVLKDLPFNAFYEADVDASVGVGAEADSADAAQFYAPYPIFLPTYRPVSRQPVPWWHPEERPVRARLLTRSRSARLKRSPRESQPVVYTRQQRLESRMIRDETQKILFEALKGTR